MIEFNKKIQAKFAQMQNMGKLFRVSLTGEQIWDLYISSFPKELDPIFRDPKSSYHTCNHCKNFLRRYGNVVTLDGDFNISTMFDVDCSDDLEYLNSAESISNAIKSSKIKDVFFETFDELKNLPYESCSKSQEQFQLGVAKNTKVYSKEEAEQYGGVEQDKIYTFNHFHVSLSNNFVDSTGKSIESIQGDFRDNKEVFQRGMETIKLEVLELVKDLIIQESLLNGKSHLEKLGAMIRFKKEYELIPELQKENWCWVASHKNNLSKFRNELIGVLCKELSEGKELNEAVQNWNKRVDPTNYMRAKSPITQGQINEAQKFVEENGYVDSFNRRLATIEDIKLSEILHLNSSEGKPKSVSLFDKVKPTKVKNSEIANLDKLEEVPIEKFMNEILPTCNSVEAYLSNKHERNLVSLTTVVNPDSKKIVKWNNHYSWTYNGNLAGKSEIKEAVRSKGGNVEGVLRFSITWNEDGRDLVDLDAHAKEPNGTHIYFSSFRSTKTSEKTSMTGQLDVDMIDPIGMGVENITWTDFQKMKEGTYSFWVENYNGKRNKGFKAEVDFNGETYSYVHPFEVTNKVSVAEVILKNKEFKIKSLIPESEVSSKEIYGLESNKFHTVNLVCLSPNHWEENEVGNKHYFFMLENCKTSVSIRSFHSENLLSDLAVHRKVLEVLALTNMIEPSEDQLSGLGFNATVRDELIVKVSETHNRMLKIKF